MTTLGMTESQLGDVRLNDVAGENIIRTEVRVAGVDAEQVVDLLGGRLERGLERIGLVLSWFLVVATVQTVVIVAVATVALIVLFDSPSGIAELEILKNLISGRF